MKWTAFKLLIGGWWQILWSIRYALLAALVGGYIGYFIGYWAKAYEGDANAALKTVSTDIQIEEKQDEIRNHRPDRNGVSQRLRSGSF